MTARITIALFIISLITACSQQEQADLQMTVYQTSSGGDKLKIVEPKEFVSKEVIKVAIDTSKTLQEITGFGGAFTESSAYLLNEISKENRQDILNAYFGENGARYSLTRTHMNSCDFSLNHYSYSPIENDTLLENFSIKEDMDDIIPMINDAKAISKDGFKIVASPWTAPPWMKDNNDWNGGGLKKEWYATWALFFSKYLEAYKKENIDIWAVTVENEPLGNDANWDSMHYTPEEMADFVKNYLGPQFENDSIDVEVLVYDQNRGEELEEWAEVLLKDEELSNYIYGTAVHWYTGTVNWFPESLQFTHELAPEKHILHTEGCVDSEVPHWKDDQWYWSKEATDWGWDWAAEEDKPNHPKYVPVYRYARDIIGCMNNWVEGWIDWNMVLDTKGGPNHASNWCVAPVIVDVDKDEVYYTPLYYVMTHFSKYIRPGATRVGFEQSSDEVMLTSVKNPDGSIVVVALNMTEGRKAIELSIGTVRKTVVIDGQAIQTIVLQS